MAATPQIPDRDKTPTNVPFCGHDASTRAGSADLQAGGGERLHNPPHIQAELPDAAPSAAPREHERVRLRGVGLEVAELRLGACALLVPGLREQQGKIVSAAVSPWTPCPAMLLTSSRHTTYAPRLPHAAAFPKRARSPASSGTAKLTSGAGPGDVSTQACAVGGLRSGRRRVEVSGDVAMETSRAYSYRNLSRAGQLSGLRNTDPKVRIPPRLICSSFAIVTTFSLPRLPMCSKLRVITVSPALPG